MKKTLLNWLFFFGSCSCLSAGPLLLQDSFNARSYALSGSVVALYGDLDTFTVNPASLGSSPSVMAGFFFLPWQDGMNLYSISAVFPFSPRNIPQGTFGLNLSIFSMDPMENYDQYGNQLSALEAGDLMGTVAYSRSVLGNLDMGVGIKYSYTRLGDKKSGVFSCDAGLIAHFRCPVIGAQPSKDSLSLGLAIRNIGGSEFFSYEDSPLPYKMIVGIDYRILNAGPYVVDMLLELNQTKDQDIKLNSGIESGLWDFLTVRMGYQILGNTLFGFSCGAGFSQRVMNYRIYLDYALLPLIEWGVRHAFSLKVRF